jgi:hypothetical protein
MREPQLLSQHERLADADHADAEHHVIADLGGLPGASFPAVHNPLAHGFEYRLGFFKCRLGATSHERQRAGFGPADAARYWRVERQRAGLAGKLVRPARRGHVDGRAVDDERAGCRGRE